MRCVYPVLLIWLMVNITQSEASTDVACDSTLKIENGGVFMTSDTTLLNVLRFSCHENFILKGEDTITCENGRVDLSKLPRCVEKKECVLNYSLQNGYISKPSRIVTGEDVTFICNKLYKLSTSYNVVTCTESGTFNKEFPTCKLKGSNCTLDQTLLNAHFLKSNVTQEAQHLDPVEFSCEHGYYMKAKSPSDAILTCNNGAFSASLQNLCHFVGFQCSVYNDTNHIVNSSLKYDKDETITLTCVANSNTSDGQPLPQIMWRYPPKLRSYVELHGDFAHQTYIESVRQNYSRKYDPYIGRYTAVGILTITPTMEVHNGLYICSVRLFNETKEYKIEIEIKVRYEVAMYCLIGIPIMLFLAIHCFYRNASTLNPFPHNKLTKSMMQEHDKKSKLDELRTLHRNPVYQKTPIEGRGRRGAVIDL